MLCVGWKVVCLVFRFLADTCLSLTDFLKEKPNPKLSNSHEEGGHRTVFCPPWRVLAVQGRGHNLTSISLSSIDYNRAKIKQEKKENLPDCLECDHSSEYTGIRRQREAGSFSSGFLIWWNHPCFPRMQCLFSFPPLMKVRQ